MRYAGIDETTFYGAGSMMSLLNSGPFDRTNEGRRDLWTTVGTPLIDVVDGYIGQEEPEEPSYENYTTVEVDQFDSHDGIHAEDIYGQYSDGLSGRSYLYDLKIKGNNVRVTGDDGIEVDDAGRTLIAENIIRHAGFGDDRDYGSGDYDGADGIHVSNVSTSIYNEGGPVFLSGLDEEVEGYEYEPTSNYALIIRNNDIRNTADDGIEVVGGERKRPRRAQALSGMGPYPYPYYGETDRVLIAENTVRRSGVTNDYESEWEGSQTGSDGLGHDGIHVRGINGTTFDSPVWEIQEGAVESGPTGPYGYYGYAVDIIDNDVRRTGDDGIEVVDSTSTLILDNKVRRAGVGGGYYYGGSDFYGADGIHVRNVGGILEGPIWQPGGAGQSGIEVDPYSIVIAENDVKNTHDDGIEVATGFRLGDGWSGDGDGIVLINDGDGWIGDGIPLQSGNGRTLIKDNLVEGAGAFFDIESEYYGDGLGADGIHVRGVQSNFRDYYDDSILVTAAPSGSFEGPSNEYDVQIIGNEITDVTDDGIEVIAAPFAETNLLVERNIIDNSGDNGIAIVSNSSFLMQPRFEELSVSLISPFGLLNSDVLDNVVTNSENNGLFAQGGGHNDVVVSGNEFTDFDIGANFESGDIDLTGDGNTFDGGRVGMRFAPAIVGFDFPETSETSFAPLVSFGEPIFADMSLVDNTIGEQTFDGQSEFYVELDNGALFEPGTPTLLNALDSTYVGTPFGTVTPSDDFADGFTVEQLAFFEDRFFHFNDNGNTGLFFFPLLPEIDQEDIFNFFGPNAGALSGLNLTLLGLPNIPGVTPIALNNITPAAGGNGGFDPNDPASLNAIETAAGGSEATCWGDATNAAGQGQAVNLSYGGSAEELLSGEASCGS